jgi:hypothetical protein
LKILVLFRYLFRYGVPERETEREIPEREKERENKKLVGVDVFNL